MRNNLASLSGCHPSLRLGADVIKASDQIRLLGVVVASDLISMGMSPVFVRRAFLALPVKTSPSFLGHRIDDDVVHAFDTSRVDY